MCAVNWGELDQEDRALLVNLVPKRLSGRVVSPSLDIPPDVAKLLWTWWGGFERVYEQRGREGLLRERDALKRRHEELVAAIQQLQEKGSRGNEGGRIRDEIREREDEADDIQKQINMIEAIFRYGPPMPEFIGAAYAQGKMNAENVRPRHVNRVASGSPPNPEGHVLRDPMKWEQTAIGLYAYLEKVDGTNDYPTALTGEFGIEIRAKAWIRGSTSTKQTRQYMQKYGYQKRGGVPSLHTALRQWILDFSQEMGEDRAVLIHKQIVREKLKWPGVPSTNSQEIQEK